MRLSLPAVSCFAFLSIAFPALAWATTWTVHPDGAGDYPTIQAAIDAAAPRDTVALGAGTFVGNGNYDLDTNGKPITILSVSRNPWDTVIDCQGTASDPRRAFLVDSGETSSTTIAWLSMHNAYMPEPGGAIRILGSSPRILGCVFVGNYSNYGGGIYCGHSDAQIIECYFISNEASYRGGGVDCHNSSTAVIDRCTFYANTSPRGTALGTRLATANVSRSILSNGDGAPGFCDSGGVIQLSCSDVFGNEGGNWVGCLGDLDGVDGNFSSDPLFCEPAGMNFRLQQDSPCLPWHTSCGEPAGATIELCVPSNIGACCLADDTCVQLTETDCEVSGGLFTGPDVPCDPPPCVAVGACCGPNNVCVVIPHLVCWFQYWDYLGDGTSCNPSPCPDIVVLPDGSGDFPTIQAAVDAAPDGHTITLASGTFSGTGNRNIVVNGKGIVIRSEFEDPTTCIVDCAGMGGGFTFSNDDPQACELRGLTLHAAAGPAVECNGSSPQIADCVVRAGVSGPGIVVTDGGPLLHRVTVAGNQGPGLQLTRSFPLVEECVVVGNIGSGILASESSFTLSNSTVSDNQSPDYGGGLYLMGTTQTPSHVSVEQSILWDNCAPTGAQAFLGDANTGVTFLCSSTEPSEVTGFGEVVYSGLQVDGDPRLCSDLGCGEIPNDGSGYLLDIESPCLSENSPCGNLVGARGEGCRLDINTYLIRPDGTGDLPTIQSAIDAAVDGDTLELADGVFSGEGNHNVDLQGKAITIRSESGDATACTIDCEGTEQSPAKGLFNLTERADVPWPVNLFVLEDITIRNAWATTPGGAIEMSGLSTVLRGVRFLGNEGTALGTACFVDGRTIDVVIEDCEFISNSGPAAFALSSQIPESITFQSCVFSSNTGSCLYWRADRETAILGIYDCLFEDNGSGHCVDGDAGFTQMVMRGSRFFSNDSGCRFEANEDSDGSLTVEDCEFEGNSGLALRYSDHGTTIRDCFFRDNPGGALSMQGEMSNIVRDCVFERNTGAMRYNEGDFGNVTVQRCKFRQNSSSGDGGAISISGWGVMRFEDSHFEGNASGGRGGAVFSEGAPAPAMLSRCVFVENIAAGPGGAVWLVAGDNSDVSDCLFADNLGSAGAAIDVSGGDITVSKSTFVANGTSGVSQIRASVAFAPFELRDSIVAFGSGVAVELDPFGEPEVACTDIFGNTGGDWVGELAPFLGNGGNISLAPLFCSVSRDDFSLAAASPCLAENNECGSMGSFPVAGCQEQLGDLLVVRPDGSGDHATIQLAIDSAADRDTVSLADGLFTGPGNRDIDFLGKAIVVRSESGDPASCIIDCEGNPSEPHRGFVFLSGEDSSSVLQNLMVRNGAAFGDGVDRFGGGIYCSGSSPTIRDCILEGNSAERNGGAINLFDSHATIEDCIIRGNEAPLGAGINSSSSSPTITGTQITGNYAAEGGGGIRYSSQADTPPTVHGSTVSGNRSSLGGGLLCASDCSIEVSNTIVWANCATTGSEFRLDSSSTVVSIDCSDVDLDGVSFAVGADFLIGDGNIAAPPLFCEALECANAPSSGGEFTLDMVSPCLDGSSPEGCGLIGAHGDGCNIVSGAPTAETTPTHLSLSSGPNPFTDHIGLRLTIPEGRLRSPSSMCRGSESGLLSAKITTLRGSTSSNGMG